LGCTKLTYQLRSEISSKIIISKIIRMYSGVAFLISEFLEVKEIQTYKKRKWDYCTSYYGTSHFLLFKKRRFNHI